MLRQYDVFIKKNPFTGDCVAIMKKMTLVILSIIIPSHLFASAGTEEDYDGRRIAHAQSRPERVELTPNDELIFAIKGCKAGVVALTTMINPLFGLFAAGYESPESSKDLRKIQDALNKSADINFRDHSSWTPLMHAAYGGYPEIVTFLLSKGARKDLCVTQEGFFSNWKGYTAMKIAQYYVEDYQKRRSTCEPKMVGYYDDHIATYLKVVNRLR